MLKNFLFRSGKLFFILVLVSAWIFSGWPTVWQYPQFPPEVKITQAASGFLDPDGDVTPNEGVLATCGTSAHFSCVDDGVRITGTPSTSGDNIITGSAGNANEERFSFNDALSDIDTATEIAVYIYHLEGGTNMQFNIATYSGGSQVGSTVLVPIRTSAQWDVATTSAALSLTQSDVNNLEVLVTCTKPGGGGGTRCTAYAVYALVIYSQPPANNAPDQPTNSSPSGGATGVSVTTSLTASTYSDTDSDPHSDTEWQVDNDSDFSSPVWTRTAGSGEETTTINTSNGTFANELSGQTQLAYSTTYYWQVRYSDGTDWSSWSTATDFATVAPTVSVSLDVSNFAYGSMPVNTSSSTLTIFEGLGIIATNDGDVTSDFDIYGADTTNWTLSASTGSDQYIHKFCNDTDNDCSTPPTNYVTLTSSPQTLKNSISVSGTVNFQLQVTTPNPSSVYTEQNAVVTIQASQT